MGKEIGIKNDKINEIISFLLEKSLRFFSGNLVSIILFGSYAKETHSNNSDIDLIIIVEKDKGYDLSKLRNEFLLKFKHKLDLHIFTKEEIVDNFNAFSPLFVTLLLGIRILFDRKMFFKIQFENFIKRMTKIDIKYCIRGKIWEMQRIAKNLRISQ